MKIPLVFVLILALFSSACSKKNNKLEDIPIPSTEEIDPVDQEVPEPPARAVSCGEIITQSVSLAEDIICSNGESYALIVVGDNVVLNGARKKIIAPDASVLVLIYASNSTVRNFDISGQPNATALYAMDTPGLTLSGNKISAVTTAISVSSWSKTVSDLKIINNQISATSDVSIFLQETLGSPITNPKIANNSIASTTSYAIFARLHEWTISDKNNLSGSKNGYYLIGGSFIFANMDLSSEQILGEALSVSFAEQIILRNSNLSLTPGSTSHTPGAHFYNVKNILIEDSIIHHRETGVRVTWDQSKTQSIQIKSSQILNSLFAGIWIQSYDNSQAQNLEIKHNTFSQSPTPIHHSGSEFANTPDISNNILTP